MSDPSKGQEQAIRAEDRRLSEVVEGKQGEAAEATMRRDFYRWEQVECPQGPRYSTREYAEIVGGITHSAVVFSVKAVRAGGNRAVTACGLGQPHPRDADAPPAEQIDTGDQTPEEHQRERVKARVSGERATVVVALAALAGKAESTVAANAAWAPARARAAVLIQDGATVEAAAAQAYKEKNTEKDAREALRTKIRAALKEASLDHGPKAINSVIGEIDVPPTWDDAQTVIAQRIEHAHLGRAMETTRKERVAEDAARPAWLIEILNVPVQMGKVGAENLARIKGDPKATRWDDNSRELLAQEVAKAQKVLDQVTDLPDLAAITPEAIINGGTV